MLLEGKVVFLTGGAAGIGRECAAAYAREGAKVAIADIAPAVNDTVAATSIQCDVSDGYSVSRAVAEVVDRFGRIDAVHNNAGIASPSVPLHETTEAEWDRLMSTNLKSLLWTTRAAIPYLRDSRGSILNTASMVGLIGQDNHAAYVATKGGMIALTKAMALDYAAWGVRVNAICPAGVYTPMLEQWCSEQPEPEKMHAYLAGIHALGYCPHGDVVADTAVFLLSEKARFITGTIMPVSGGAELGYRR